MRQVSIKNLYRHLSNELQNLPFEVTKQNIPFAIVSPVEKKYINNAPILPKVELKLSPCLIPSCKLSGPFRPDYAVFNATLGEMTPMPGHICLKHYLLYESGK